MADIRIIEHECMDLRGAFVIDGFPSVGLVGAIAANYLASLLELRLIGTMESEGFPNLTVIRKGVPLSPVRIYAGNIGDQDEKIVVLVSEFQPQPDMIRPLAQAIMNWVQKKKCRMVFSPEGFVENPNQDVEEAINDVLGERPEVSVCGAASTIRSLGMLKEAEIALYQNGVIIGLAGMLLNEGVKRGIDVVALLAETNPIIPDARAAAAVTSAIDHMLLQVEFDLGPLLEEAKVIEDGIRQIYQNAVTKDEKTSNVRPIMYG